MRFSLFSKLVLIYLTITVLLTAAASFGLSRFFAHYFFEQKRDQLLAQGVKINSLVADYRTGRLDSAALKRSLDLIGYATNSRVYVLNIRGDSLTSLEAARTPAGLVEQDLFKDIEKILGGKTVFSYRRFISTLEMPVVFAGIPLTTGQETNGVILFLAPLTAVEKPLSAVNRVLIQSSLAVVVVAVLVIFLVSRRITRPIMDMSRAAARVAEGDYSQQILVRDRDEIGQLAQSFTIMQERLETMERMRRELIADISHELRTPLASIRGFVQGILDGVVRPEEKTRYLSLVLNETTRLTSLVSDLLELARVQAGAIHLEYSEVDPAALMAEVADSFSLPSAEKGIALQTTGPPRTIRIPADRNRLKQVLLNLVSNAVRYTPRGGTISLVLEEGPDGVTIKVADTGPGVPEEELPKIFEKFHRLDKSRDSATGGAGLGLAIVKQLVELHGGNITARNRKDGPGLEVSFNIPIKMPKTRR
ncbi:MAG: ATP-binding protein [Bacillota bacterium]